MQFVLRNKNLILVSLLIIALLPYFIICFYALPFADDFCFGWTASEKIPFIDKSLNQYLKWNGRYTADVLVNLHPLITGKIINYHLIVFFSLFATPLVLWVFLQTVLINGKLTSFIASLLITISYLNYQPNVTEGIYWFIGIVNYHWSNLLFILQLTLLIKSFSAKRTAKIFLLSASAFLLIFSIGFNEIGAMLCPLAYLVIYLKKRRSELLLLFLLGLIASAFVFFSPGNFVRANEFENRFNLLHSLLYASLQTIRFLSKWILTPPFLSLSLIIIAHSERVKSRINFDYRTLFVALLMVVFMGSFIPYLATGILGQHRTINFVFFYFLLLWIVFLISTSRKFSLHRSLAFLKTEKSVFIFLAASIFFMIFSGRGLNILKDFSQNKFRKYEAAFYSRQSAILKNPELPIQPLTTIPEVFLITDAKADTTWWVDKCMKNFYSVTKVELR